MKGLEVERVRRQFPALSREVAGRPAVYFDGPAGSQVPGTVIEAMREYLAGSNANHGGLFATSIESDALLEGAHRAAAEFLGESDPDLVAFGANMTSLTLSVSRAFARTWKPGDEVVVTALDHDANVTPWVLAAEDAGAVVRLVAIHTEDCTLDMDDLAKKLNERTRLVAVGCASNATGTINPVRKIAQMAHAVGARVFLDAVHYAPHAALDVRAWDCDMLVCSAYKFFGPHVGMLWGRRELMEGLPVYKVRPAPMTIPGRWMTGTQSHEAIAGARAAIDYLAELGRSLVKGDLDRRAGLEAAFRAIQRHERVLLERLNSGLVSMPEVKVWGITDPARFAERVPTVSFTHQRAKPHAVATHLAQRGIFVWHGNFYALPLTEALGLEPDGMVRVGLLHYNTVGEVDRFLEALAELT